MMNPMTTRQERTLTFSAMAAIIAAIVMLLLLPGCVHEPPVAPDDPLAGGNGGGGNGGGNGDPCDSSVVYFQQQVLPILISNCAVPGCHNTANDDNDWIEITSYTSLMNSGVVQDGDLWEAITENDPDKIMPPPPASPLTPDQIALIGAWIQQGAQNNSCENAGCDTLNVTWSGTIQPLIQAKCQGCHSGSTPQGGLDFTSWPVVNTVALDGRLAGAIQFQGGYAAMPPSGGMLPQCDIDKFLIWIQDGAPNN